jgi:hypothetical protein
MYTEEVMSVSRTDDGGFVVGIRVKAKKKREDKCEVGLPREHKTLIAKDVDEVKSILDKVLPDLKEGMMEEDEFAKAFKDAVKED